MKVWLVIITATYPMHCGGQNYVQDVFSCRKGGFITLRHNHIRNVTTELLSQVTKDVKLEPLQQSLTGETFVQRRANTSDDAQLDINAREFWTKYQMVFFDVRAFDPNAKRYGALMSHGTMVYWLSLPDNFLQQSLN